MNQEVEYRRLKCPNESCGKILRIKIQEKHFGKTVRVTCPQCREKCDTTIPHPPPKKEDPNFSPMDALEKIFGLFSSLKKK